MLLAVLVFALMDVCLKTLSTHYPPFQVAFLRGASSLPLVLAWALATRGWRDLISVRWPLHLLRGVLGVAMMASFVFALRTLPRRDGVAGRCSCSTLAPGASAPGSPSAPATAASA